MTSDQLDHRPRRNPLAWGVFLATSWTWCIGMFLPVLLVNRYGFAGWFVFALPNIVGAAAMGWILRDAEQSRRMVQKHRAACVMFSLVTILFHLYFIGWIIARMIYPLSAAVTVLLAAAMWYWMRSDRQSVRIAVITYVLSLLAFFVIITYSGVPSWNQSEFPTPFGMHGVAWLFPVCCLGFLTCPYLDLTFHRARQGTSRDGAKIAFGIGFGVFFLLMIFFTLWYAQTVYHRIFAAPAEQIAFLIESPGLIICLIGFHMVIQSAFTIAAHTRAISSSRSVPIAPSKIVPGLFLLGFAGAIVLPRVFFASGTTIYLLFMSFYALVVPAYFCCQVLTRCGQGWLFVIPVILATPFYWLGFFQNWTIWLLPGVAIVLIAAIIAHYSGSSAASASSESLPARQESIL